MNADQITQPAAWPEGVIGRYLTVGGATVDIQHDAYYVYDTEPTSTVAKCGGCLDTHTEQWAEYADSFDGGTSWADKEARKWAQAHAETCRALPRPEVTQ